MPLVAAVARVYRNTAAVERRELMQEGVVGLLRAFDRFDPDRGVPFWAYASWWVRQAMQQLVAELTRPVVLSDRALRQLARIKDAHAEHARAEGRDPSHADIAARTGLPIDQVRALLAADRSPRGMEEPLPGEDDRSATFGDRISDPSSEDAYDRALRRIDVRDLHKMLGRLNERERMVLQARFGLGGHAQTLAEIADTLGVTAERVRQIEQRALAAAA